MSTHWTEREPSDFVYSIATDFVEQLRVAMRANKCSQSKLAKLLHISRARVSQVFNDPGNLTLETMVIWSRALGLKTSVLLYDDGDKANERGPVNSEVFNIAWQRAGQPLDFSTLKRDCAKAR